MVDVIFDLTTNDSWSVDDAICEGKGRWATGKRLTNRLPKLSLITQTCTSTLMALTIGKCVGMLLYRKPYSKRGALRMFHVPLSN